MKHLFLLVLLVPVMLTAQTVVVNQKDEFTGASIKRTNYERFTSSSKDKLWGNVRISQVDSLVIMELKLQLGGGVFSVRKGGKVMFKLKDGSVVELISVNDELSTIGGGAIDMVGSKNPGLQIQCVLSDSEIASLKSSAPTKVRVYTTDGYVEADIKDSYGEKIVKMISLIKP